MLRCCFAFLLLLGFFSSFLVILFRKISLIIYYVKSSPFEKHLHHQVLLAGETRPPLALDTHWGFLLGLTV